MKNAKTVVINILRYGTYFKDGPTAHILWTSQDDPRNSGFFNGGAC